jgi:hypothetical protein
MILSRDDITRGDVLVVRAGDRLDVWGGEDTQVRHATVGGVIEVRQKADGDLRVVAIYGGTFTAAIVSRASLGLPSAGARS